MSVARTHQATVDNEKKCAQDLPENPVNQATTGDAPKMLQAYKAAQSASPLWSLPTDVEQLILSASGDSVFKLGMTCKYCNVQVRTFLTESPQGRKVLRQKYEAAFRQAHGMSVVNAFRDLESTSFQKFFDFDDSTAGKLLAEELKSSEDPVYLIPPSKGSWMTANLKSALAARGCRLTIIGIDAPDAAGISSLIDAITAIPSNGFVALSMSSATLSSPKAAEIWGAISRHPVVAHIECYGRGELSTGDQVIEWITLLSRKNANVSSFSLNNCRLDNQSSDALSRLLGEETGISQLEVCESETSAENADNLFTAVRARNTSADTKLTLNFTARNLKDLINVVERSVLEMDGIYIREPGQPWAIQREPVVTAPAREEFDTSSDDSDVRVDSSSNSEG